MNFSISANKSAWKTCNIKIIKLLACLLNVRNKQSDNGTQLRKQVQVRQSIPCTGSSRPINFKPIGDRTKSKPTHCTCVLPALRTG